MSIPTIPMVNLSYLYCFNMYLAWVSATKITVTGGQCRDSTNVNDITIPGAISDAVITINTTLQGAGGLDQGTIAVSTVYAVYAIGDSTDYVASSALLSTSFTQPVLPKNFDMFRRIGQVLTDSSGNILQFIETGADTKRTFWFDLPIEILTAGASATFVAVPTAAYAYTSFQNLYLNAEITPTAASNTATLQPTGATSANGYVIISGVVASQHQYLQVIVPGNGAGSLEYKVTGTLSLWLNGFDDALTS